ncbi:MAG: DUF4249 domain-containing protein [Cyclobacteriaceae bacterium]|nr:DUF4249 domain-containing protein [Cyclobacteriaceae bacterium]
MKSQKEVGLFWRIKFRWLLVFVLLSACVDHLDITLPEVQPIMIIEGKITDDPGPYTVLISKGVSLEDDSLLRVPIERAKIKLYDDLGNSEDMVENTPGEYMSTGVIRGQIGHSYHIGVEMADGGVFISEPDLLSPVGEIEAIKYEFEARSIERPYIVEPANIFKIFVDAKAIPGDKNYVRWKFTGTYKVITRPELHTYYLQGVRISDPRPCSGYVVRPGSSQIVKVDECTCCTCWITEYESTPHLSDGQFISGDSYKNVRIGDVQISTESFFEKYLVEAEQMSLSKNAFEFFSLVRKQKSEPSNIFQAPMGNIAGNISSSNSQIPYIGIFWATSIKTRSIYIERSAIPYNLPPPKFIPESCLAYFKNSSTTKPPLWQ